MKYKIIICVAQVFLSSLIYAQNAKPVAQPAIAETKIAAVPEPKVENVATTTTINPDIKLQLKPVNQSDNIALPITTIDTKTDNSKYYNNNDYVKPKPIEIPKQVESNKTPQQIKKPNAVVAIE
jgi:hypothetical protein